MKGFSFFEQYKQSFSYLKESMFYIHLAIFIFVLSAIIGYFVPIPEEISSQIMQYFRELVEKTKDYGVLQMIIFLFSNNLFASFLGLFLGVFFGIFPLLNGFINGFMIGFVSEMVISEKGIFSLWRIFPHGIFELPAIFISLGLGLKLGTITFKKDLRKSFREYFGNSLRVFVFVVIPLLILAAIIEGILIVLIS